MCVKEGCAFERTIDNSGHTLDKVLSELGGALFKESVADELGNPGTSVDIAGNSVGIGVGGEEVSSVLGETQEQWRADKLFVGYPWCPCNELQNVDSVRGTC